LFWLTACRLARHRYKGSICGSVTTIFSSGGLAFPGRFLHQKTVCALRIVVACFAWVTNFVVFSFSPTGAVAVGQLFSPARHNGKVLSSTELYRYHRGWYSRKDLIISNRPTIAGTPELCPL